MKNFIAIFVVTVAALAASAFPGDRDGRGGRWPAPPPPPPQNPAPQPPPAPAPQPPPPAPMPPPGSSCSNVSEIYQRKAQSFCDTFRGTNYAAGCYQEAAQVYYIEDEALNYCYQFSYDNNNKMYCFQSIKNKQFIGIQDVKNACYSKYKNSEIQCVGNRGFSVDQAYVFKRLIYDLAQSATGFINAGQLDQARYQTQKIMEVTSCR